METVSLPAHDEINMKIFMVFILFYVQLLKVLICMSVLSGRYGVRYFFPTGKLSGESMCEEEKQKSGASSLKNQVETPHLLIKTIFSFCRKGIYENRFCFWTLKSPQTCMNTKKNGPVIIDDRPRWLRGPDLN